MTNEFDDIAFLIKRCKAEKDPKKQLRTLKAAEQMLRSAIVAASIRIKQEKK